MCAALPAARLVTFDRTDLVKRSDRAVWIRKGPGKGFEFVRYSPIQFNPAAIVKLERALRLHENLPRLKAERIYFPDPC